MFASVVINVASSNVDQMYEYSVPSDLAPYIKVGARVNVEFGVGNRLVMGYVLDVYDEDGSSNNAIRGLNEVGDIIYFSLNLENTQYAPKNFFARKVC